MAITAGFNVRWPAPAQAFFEVMKAVSLNIGSWLGAACLTGTSTMTIEVVAKWSIPVVAVVVTILAAVLVSLVKGICKVTPCCRRFRRRLPSMGAWDSVRVLIFGLSLFFPALLSSTLSVFTCLPPLEGHWQRTGWTVKDFPHVECGRSEDNWFALAIISGLLAASLVICFPILIYNAWVAESVARLKSNFEEGGWWSFFFEDFRAVHTSWILNMLCKDIGINLVACIGAGHGAIQLMLTAGISLWYAMATMRRLPYADHSNSILETWNGVVVAILCIFTAGMGFQAEPGVGDVTELFAAGDEDPKYTQRVWAVVTIQFLCLAGPVLIIAYQLLMAFERTRRLVPRCLHPLSHESRREWLNSFMTAMDISEEEHGPLMHVLSGLDDIEYAAFKQVMTSTAATLGYLGSDGSVRWRLSKVARKRRTIMAAIAGRIPTRASARLQALGVSGSSVVIPEASGVGSEAAPAAAAPADATASASVGPSAMGALGSEPSASVIGRRHEDEVELAAPANAPGSSSSAAGAATAAAAAGSEEPAGAALGRRQEDEESESLLAKSVGQLEKLHPTRLKEVHELMSLMLADDEDVLTL